MVQGALPNIFGRDWSPSKPLIFFRPLPAEMAKVEILRFLAEKHEGNLQTVSSLWDHVIKDVKSFDGDAWHAFSASFINVLAQGLESKSRASSIDLEMEVIPRRTAGEHLARRNSRFIIDMRLCMRRLAHYMSVEIEQRFSWQRMMTRTREMDEVLKKLFMEGIETPDGGRFGGKGFRSTWQEAVVAVATALNSGPDFEVEQNYTGDFVAPMIRDVGLSLAMGDTVLDVMAAQLGKAESRMNGGHAHAGGRDLHIGAFHKGVLPPTAPLPIASATMTGMALAAQRLDLSRFHVACIGEGSSSSGEWWEAVNFASTRGLPITYILQNNQIALDTPPSHQSNVELWGDKARAMGMPSWTIDGSDPASWYASTAVAREFSLEGGGPTLIHVETMRGCGHAHHHDDLYLGTESGNPPGYVDRELLEYWANKDPLSTHRELLLELGVTEEQIQKMESDEFEMVSEAFSQLELMEWPEPNTVTKGVTSIHDADSHANHLDRWNGREVTEFTPSKLMLGEMAWEYSEKGGWTYARAIQQAMVDIAGKYGINTLFMGEDMEVAGAFGLNMGLKNAGHDSLLLDMPLSESIIINAAVGAALSGMRPMAEIQFGGFAALAHNALVNNASMLRWRWGADVPLTVRIPLGAKTRSGPFHANMIESWYANDPGLIVVAPATPQDAYDLLIEAANVDHPVLFLEHIGLYGLRGGMTGWGQNINQVVDVDEVHNKLESDSQFKLGKAEIIRGGRDLTLVTWGSMLHLSLQAAELLAEEDIEVEVIDLRTLLPFDAKTCIQSVMRTCRLIIVQEGQWSGGLGHTIQSRILEETFYLLESAPLVVGAIDTPVPFSPPLENHTIPSLDFIIDAIRTACND